MLHTNVSVHRKACLCVYVCVRACVIHEPEKLIEHAIEVSVCVCGPATLVMMNVIITLLLPLCPSVLAARKRVCI